MSYGDVDRVKGRTRGDFETFGFDTEAEFTDFIQDFLDQASDEIERFTGRDFKLHEGETEQLPGNGRREISTRNMPVVSIDSLEAFAPDQYRIVPTPSYAVDNTGRIKVDRGRRFGRTKEYEITYTWGFESVPPGVNGIAEEMVINAINADTAEIEGGAVASESMDGYSVQYDLMDMGQKLQLTENMRERLKPYQNMAWG